MKTDIKKDLRRQSGRPARRFNPVSAFTLTELLVIVATLVVLSVILLPALAGSRAQPKITACAANFRQWAVSVNLYANDNLERLPRFDWNGGGGNYLWDVATNMIPGITPYGLTVPVWFCPVRPNEFDALQKQYGKPIITIQDLEAALGNPFRENIINHNWWVPRSPVIPAIPASSTSPGSLFPPDPTVYSLLLLIHPYMKGTPVGMYGFPTRLHDNAAAHVPFISDKAGSSVNGNGFAMPPTGKASTNPNDCSPNTAHFVNGVLLGVNAAYADGHVESHNPSQMNCGYDQGDPYWYY